jgi:hypothetical protein
MSACRHVGTLSTGRVANRVRETASELPVPVVQWGYQESNLGPHPYQGCALTD